jgi:hypothetical protein
MSTYNPDKWVMLKFTCGDEVIYKILASWYGGFARGDSWQLNSGVVKIEEDGDLYLFYGSSGSVYQCHKQMYGMSMYTRGILEGWKKKIEEVEDTDVLLMPEETNFMELEYK